MPLVEYKYRDTFLHNLHPLVKILFFITLGYLRGLYWDLRLVIPLLILTLVLIWTSKIPSTLFKYTFAFWAALWINPGSLLTSSLMARSAFFKVLPQDFVSHEILQITPEDFPFLGYTAITYGTLYYYLTSRLRSLVTLSIASLSIHTINFSDLVQVLMWLKLPSLAVLAFMMQYRFAVVFQRKMELLLRSLRLRGWHLTRSINLRVMLRDFIQLRKPFAIGLGLLFVDVTFGLNKVITIRGYRNAKIHPSRLYNYSFTDYLVTSLCVFSVPVALYLLLNHNVGMI